MGVAQSDWQYHAYHGSSKFKDQRSVHKELRAIFSVHPEPFDSSGQSLIPEFVTFWRYERETSQCRQSWFWNSVERWEVIDGGFGLENARSDFAIGLQS